MTPFNKRHRFANKGVWLQECLFLMVCFFLLLQVHPVLILESQSPAFLKGTDFLIEFLKIPGGLTDWSSAFFMQLWFSDFLGAFFLTLCFWIVGFLTRKWIETLTEIRPIYTFHLIPVGFLLALQNQYDFRLSITLALIINLFFLILFIRWAPKQKAIRAILGLAISVLLYWTTGGAFLTFAVLCGLDDLFFRKQIANGLLLLIISSVLPFAASASVFIITLKQAYLHNLIIEYGLPAFFLLTLTFTSVKFLGIQKVFQKKARQVKFVKLTYVLKLAIGTLFLLGGTILLTQKTHDDSMRFSLQVNKFVKDSRWLDVLELTHSSPYSNPLLSCQMNLALFETNVMLEKMFVYPQTLGTDGLLMNQTWCLAWPEEASNVYWKLGLVNEPLHWAHEALECKGPTPNLLKRLGMVYMLKGDHKAANLFFVNLKQVPFQENIAENLIRLNENPTELAQDSAYKNIRSCMPVEDLVSLGGSSLPELELLLKQNPKNKMAFEYQIAFYLLNGDVKEIWNRISNIGTMASSEIPRYVQEALLVNAVLTPKFDFGQLKKMVQPINYNRFVEYQKILHKYGGNKNGAQQDLKIRFGDTYWYYLMFVKPASRQSDNQNEYHN